MPSPGYKSPRKVAGLHSSGLKPVNVFTVDDINKIKKEAEGIVVSKKVGTKKRFEILKKAKEFNATVLNLDIDWHIKKIEDFINSKKKKGVKEEKKEYFKEKEKSKERPIELTEEQKKKADKKAKDRMLTKKVW